MRATLAILLLASCSYQGQWGEGYVSEAQTQIRVLDTGYVAGRYHPACPAPVVRRCWTIAGGAGCVVTVDCTRAGADTVITPDGRTRRVREDGYIR